MIDRIIACCFFLLLGGFLQSSWGRCSCPGGRDWQFKNAQFVFTGRILSIDTVEVDTYVYRQVGFIVKRFKLVREWHKMVRARFVVDSILKSDLRVSDTITLLTEPPNECSGVSLYPLSYSSYISDFYSRYIITAKSWVEPQIKKKKGKKNLDLMNEWKDCLYVPQCLSITIFFQEFWDSFKRMKQ